MLPPGQHDRVVRITDVSVSAAFDAVDFDVDVDAIFADFDLPEKFAYALELNSEFFAEQGTAERTAA